LSLDEGIQEIKIYAEGKGSLQIPIPGSLNPDKMNMLDEKGNIIKFEITDHAILLEMNSKISGKWLSLN